MPSLSPNSPPSPAVTSAAPSPAPSGNVGVGGAAGLPVLTVTRLARETPAASQVGLAGLVAPLATGLASALAVLYACVWAGGRLAARNSAFWPAVALVCWAMFAAGLNVWFLRKHRREMAAAERRNVGGLVAALAGIVVVGGSGLLLVGEFASAALAEATALTVDSAVGELLFTSACTLAVATPASGIAAFLAVCPPVQAWFASMLGVSLTGDAR